MGWCRATKQQTNPQPSGLSHRKEGLCRFSEEFEPYVHDLRTEIEIKLPASKTPQAISDGCAALLPLRQVTKL
jgi:hypothetical protein